MKYLAMVVLCCVTDVAEFPEGYRDEAVEYLREKYIEFFPQRETEEFDDAMCSSNTFYIYDEGVSVCFQIMRVDL